MNVKLFIIIFVLFIVSCKDTKDCHRRIKFYNNSSQDVYACFSWDVLFPDTTIDKTGYDESRKANANSFSESSLLSRDCWESFLTSDDKIMDTLMIFVFDAKIYEDTSWDTIVSNYMILKRYDFSLKDLEDRNWIIIYP
jgi:hypothetical protein